MGDDNFIEWLDQNEGDLMYEYAQWVVENNFDEIVERVFWWRNPGLNAINAQEAFDSWASNKYEAYCQDRPEHDD